MTPPARHTNLPEWIVSGSTPIPALPAFTTQAMTTRMHAFIMTLIDGRRTLEDMAAVLEEQKLMDRREARTALRGFLIRMYDEARLNGRPPVPVDVLLRGVRRRPGTGTGRRFSRARGDRR